jgi:hypothetical protein
MSPLFLHGALEAEAQLWWRGIHTKPSVLNGNTASIQANDGAHIESMKLHAPRNQDSRSCLLETSSISSLLLQSAATIAL